MLKRSALFFICAALSFDLNAAGRRPPAGASLEGPAMSMSYLPRVEKMADRYRMTIQSPQPLPHYLIEKSPKKIWLRLVRPSNDSSQILEGDSVIKEIRLVQREYSADMIVKLGDDAVSNDVYFDDGMKTIVVDVFTSERVSRQVAESPEVAQAPVLRDKRAARAAKKKTFVKAAPKPKTEAVLVAALPKATQPVMKPATTKSDAPVLTVRKSPKEQLIVIDAGHGGMDSGAIGTRGTMEKDINLEFAESLASLLEKEKNVRVIMTRTNDKFIPLDERTRIANTAGADLFISVHCNSSLSNKSTGFETYFLSPDASDKAAASVARLENSVVALEANKGAGSDRLSQMLASMAVGDHLNESSKFASIMCRNIRLHTSEDKAEVKEADFFVLRGAQMPAILLELEYVSNPISELKLRSSRYRSQLVKGVVEAVKSYTQQARQEREAIASQLPTELINTAR